MKIVMCLQSLICVSLLLAVAVPSLADIRSITVTITVTDPDGIPIADVPLQSYTKNGITFGFTNIEGQLIAVVDADEGESMFATRLWDGAWHNNLSITERILAEQRDEELRNQYSLKPKYTMPIEAGIDQYTLSIIAVPGVRIRGRLVNAQGQPIAGAIGAANTMAYDSVEEDDEGVFDFGGVRKGAATLLLAQYSTQVHFIEITAAQTLEDLDLGDVVLLDASADAPVRVTMQNQQYLLDSTGASLGLTASFISIDGSVVVGFPADLEGNVIREHFYVPTRLPLLPPGEYYAVPGLITSQSGMALYLSIREGRQAQLDAAGVPKITAISGQEVSLTFDARAAYEAVVQVGGDLVPE